MSLIQNGERRANAGITVRRASIVIGKSSIDFTSFCRIWARLVASPTRIPPPRSCPEILLEDSNPRPIIERRSCRPGINQSAIEEHCVSTVHRVVFAAASSPITRITEVESSEPKFSNPLTLYNYIVKFKIIRSIANSYKDKLYKPPPRSIPYFISSIFSRTFEFFEISSFSHSQRVPVRDKREYRLDIPSKRQSNPPLSPRQNISPIGMIHDLPVERRVQREREIKEIRVDCVAPRRTIRLEYTVLIVEDVKEKQKEKEREREVPGIENGP